MTPTAWDYKIVPMYDTQTNVKEGRIGEVREEEDCQPEVAGEGSGGASIEEGDIKVRVVFIYALICPITGQIRYVGKTIEKLYQRLCQHYRPGKNTHKDAWIASLKKQGLRPKIIELERFENSDGLDWQEAERFWITYLRFLGCRLTNLVPGGEGTTEHAEETKRKIGNGNRGKKRTPEQREAKRQQMLGRTLTPEHCANMSKAVKGKPRGKYSAERVEKTASKLRGKKRPPRSREHCEKISLALTGRPVSKETRKKISEVQKGKKRGPYPKERGEAISRALKGRTIPEEARKNMSVSALKRWGKLPKDQPPSDPCTS